MTGTKLMLLLERKGDEAVHPLQRLFSGARSYGSLLADYPLAASQERVMERFVESLGKDRRLAKRHLLRMPLQFRLRKSNECEQRVEAKNVSRRGVFFTTHLPLDEGMTLDLLLEMPEGVSGVRTAQWMCMGHVVRVEQSAEANGVRGVGVEFDFYVVSHTATPKWTPGPGIRGPITP